MLCLYQNLINRYRRMPVACGMNGEVDMAKVKIENILKTDLKRNLKKMCKAVVVPLAVLALSGCGSGGKMSIPDVAKIDSVMVTAEEKTVIHEDREWIEELSQAAEHSELTSRQSVNDTPMTDDYIKVELITGEDSDTIYLYKAGSSYYAERPYEGIYKIEEDLYDFVLDGE